LKHTKFVFVLFFILILFFGYNQWVFSLGFFKLFSETEYSEAGLQKVQEFNPEKDTLYLPGIENKELFESIEDLSICRNDEVRKYIYLYLTSGREYLIKSIERSHIYIDIINDIMKKNPDIPSEIALLPLLESGFEPNAVSSSNAVGLWQFLRSTSVLFDLKSDKWIEERRDIEKSTEAAILHLRYLKKDLKSWDLALAAYNGGGGQLRRAMNKTGAVNIWELIKSGALTKETSEYVPRYAALVIIYNNQRLFGIINEVSVPQKIKTETVMINHRININEFSEKYDVEIDEIKRYNPELNGPLTPPSSENYVIRLTDESAKKIRSNYGVFSGSIIAYPENYILTLLPPDLLF